MSACLLETTILLKLPASKGFVSTFAPILHGADGPDQYPDAQRYRCRRLAVTWKKGGSLWHSKSTRQHLLLEDIWQRRCSQSS